MTPYDDLRRHLVERHELNVSGLSYAGLVAIHNDDHRLPQDHDHEDRTDAS